MLDLNNSLCCSVGGFNNARVLLLAKEEHPEWFRSGIEITSVFDSFAGLIWNGGRSILGAPISLAAMRKVVDFFNSRNIGLRFVFTNNLLTEQHLQHELGNQVLREFENSLNAVVVNSELLEAHIRKKHPLYKIIFSITKLMLDKDKLLTAADKYDLVVIPPEFNKDMVFLVNFPSAKAEIPTYEPCVPYCPHRLYHYTLFSQQNLGLISDIPDKNYCPFAETGEKGKMYLYLEDMLEIFRKTNINQFKLTIRGFPLEDAIRILAVYFVHVEHTEIFYEYCIKYFERGCYE